MPHIRLRRVCGVCGEPLLAGEIFVALVGKRDSSALDFCTEPGVFPPFDPPHGRKTLASELHGFNLCRAYNCTSCALSPETAPAHPICVQLFRKRCQSDDALDRLWACVSAREPWRGAPDFWLPERSVNTVPASEAAALGIPQLCLLPFEVIQMIHSFSESHLFWRCCYVIAVARALSEPAVAEEDSLSVPLCDVLSWMRGGGGPVIAAQEGKPRILSLTIDARGIKRLERLPEHPRQYNGRSDSNVFIIEDVGRFANIVASFKHGLLRLLLPKSMREFDMPIWDSPTPPRLEDCVYLARRKNYPGLLRTISLNSGNITGLTFVFGHGLDDIVIHTPESPNVGVPRHRDSRRPVWLYLPLPPGEQILFFGVQVHKVLDYITIQRPRLLFRTKLAGDVSLGLYYAASSMGSAEDHPLSGANPTLLFHNVPEWHPISFYGTYPCSRDVDDQTWSFQHPTPGPPPFEAPFFSSAPLEDVTEIAVFNDRDTGFLCGMLLSYNNMAQRALGQCRLGIDPVESYGTPSHICFLRTTYPAPDINNYLLKTLRIIASMPGHHHDEEGWTCWEMEGTLEFWFSRMGESDLTRTVAE